jgi:hypothetical protein
MLALHFHWPRTELLRLDHAERARWVQELRRLQAAVGPARPTR